MPELTVLFDGHCSLCRKSAERVRRFDRLRRIELVELDQPSVRQRFPEIDGEEAMKWMLAVDRRGRVYRGAGAWAQIGLRLPGWGLLARLVLLPAFHGAAVKVYAWVARNRYRSNRTACADGSCGVHRAGNKTSARS